MRKNCLFLLFFFLANLLFAPALLAAEPLRVAILPVINQSHTHDENVEKVIREALQLKFHKPLHDIVPVYQVIPAHDVIAALPVDLHKRPGSLKFKRGFFPPLAASLHADVVIGAIIQNLSETSAFTWRGDYLQDTHVTIRVVVYEARTQKYFDKRASEHYFGEPMLRSNADYLAQPIMDRMLKKVMPPPV